MDLNNVSPIKQQNTISRRNFFVPETPDEKTTQKNLSQKNEDDEVIPQTPIGKIKRGKKLLFKTVY